MIIYTFLQRHSLRFRKVLRKQISCSIFPVERIFKRTIGEIIIHLIQKKNDPAFRSLDPLLGGQKSANAHENWKGNKPQIDGVLVIRIKL